MAPNHKLTKIIQGRTIQSTQSQDNALLIAFDDGSILKVKTAAAANSAGSATAPGAGGKVKAVRQGGTELQLDFEDGSTLHLHTAEATSSVMLRDKNHVMEYAD